MHFLFKDGAAATARRAVQAAGIRVAEERDVLVQRLNQEEPGQLGKISYEIRVDWTGNDGEGTKTYSGLPAGSYHRG